ncbi:MAG: DUF1592 domain-containing protein, partial [Candidatus Hydrogenedentota bacterium]
MMRNRIPMTALLVIVSAQVIVISLSYAQTEDTGRVVRLIEQRCVKCHGGDVVNGGIDFSDMKDELDVWKYRHTYEKALDMLARDKMPPDTEPVMAEGMRSFLVDWIEHTLDNVDIERIPHDPGFLPPRRLNRYEYNYTVQDVFGIDVSPADLLPVDQVVGDAFDNDTSTLTVEPLWFERALTVANDTVRAVWSDAEALDRLLFVHPSPPIIEETALYVASPELSRNLNTGDGDFTVLARVKGNFGHIFTTSLPGEGFRRGSKQLSFRRNSLTYRIRLGREITVKDIDIRGDEEHLIGLTVEDDRASLYLDGRLLASVADFSGRGNGEYLFKVGMPARAPREEDEDSEEETKRRDVKYPGIEDFWFISEAMSEESILEFTGGKRKKTSLDSSLHWHPGVEMTQPESTSPEEAAGEVLDRFLTKAFRRRPTDEEKARYLDLFGQGSSSGFPFDIAMQLPITAALSSPSFLFRSEEAVRSDGIVPVSSMEMASRLSYFLWSSLPDDELLSVAEDGRLADSEELLRQTDRMLDDEKADRFFERFVVQWLRTDGLGDTIKPDGDRFPTLSDSLMAAMRQEGVMVFGDLVRGNRPLTRLLEDETTFMNGELAAHYGYPNAAGDEWQRVALSDSSRGGLLTQAATLTVSSSPRRTSPVFRGKWVLDVLLGEPPPPPPANVPPL